LQDVSISDSRLSVKGRYVVLDAPKWEQSVAFQLEKMPEVIAYARNDHLDFTIPYERCAA